MLRCKLKKKAETGVGLMLDSDAGKCSRLQGVNINNALSHDTAQPMGLEVLAEAARGESLNDTRGLLQG